jgi:hypothetical protein
MPKEHRAGSGRPAMLSLNIFMIQSTGVLIKIALEGRIVNQGSRKGSGGSEGRRRERKTKINK